MAAVLLVLGFALLGVQGASAAGEEQAGPRVPGGGGVEGLGLEEGRRLESPPRGPGGEVTLGFLAVLPCLGRCPRSLRGPLGDESGVAPWPPPGVTLGVLRGSFGEWEWRGYSGGPWAP